MNFLFFSIPFFFVYQTGGLTVKDFPVTDDSGEVVSLFVLFRNGDRGPTSSFPNDTYFKPEYWPQGYGQLTTRGIQRQYDLGKWLREKYHNFLPETFSPADVHIFSINLDRTLMSAAANLAGLYPPKGKQIWNDNLLWQPIPVYTSPGKADEIFPDSDDCPKYKKEYKEVKKSDHFQEIKKKYANLFTELAKLTGMKVDSIKDVKDVRDVIYCYENYDTKYLPTWASNLNRGTLDEVTGIFLERYSYTDKMKKLLAGPFFHKLIKHFDNASNKTQSHKKLYMVSAHEGSIVSVLDTLGAYDMAPPKFASTVIFQLKKSGSNYYINVLYKQLNDVKELSIGDCGSSCDYNNFKKLLSKYEIDYDSWKSECN